METVRQPNIVELAYLAILFPADSVMFKYLDLLKAGQIKNPCYVKCTAEDLNQPEYGDHIFILLKDTQDKYLDKLISLFRKHSALIKINTFYIDAQMHYSATFVFPFGYTRDCRYIKDGFYSKIFIDTKHRILNAVRGHDRLKLRQVLYKIEGVNPTSNTKMIPNERGELYARINDPIELETWKQPVQ